MIKVLLSVPEAKMSWLIHIWLLVGGIAVLLLEGET